MFVCPGFSLGLGRSDLPSHNLGGEICVQGAWKIAVGLNTKGNFCSYLTFRRVPQGYCSTFTQPEDIRLNLQS